MNFWNTWTAAGTSFQFRQKTGAAASSALMSIFPSGKVDVNGDLSLKGQSAMALNGANLAVGDIASSEGAITTLTFRTNDSARMTVDGNGNVGIGTTTPGYGLQVNASEGNGWVAGFQSTDGTKNGRVLLGSRAASSGSVQGATNAGAASSLLLNPDGGNVGIGTTSPGSKLDINSGFLRVTQDKASTGELDSHLVLRGSANTNETLSLGFDTTNNFGWIQANDYGTANRALVLQPNGGNVGIGTTSPGAKLHIAGYADTDTPGPTILALTPHFGFRRDTSERLILDYYNSGYWPMMTWERVNGYVGIGLSFPKFILPIA